MSVKYFLLPKFSYVFMHVLYVGLRETPWALKFRLSIAPE